MAAEGQSGRMVSDMEVCMKQRCGIKLTVDSHWHLLNVYGDQTVGASTVRQWVECFSSGNSHVLESLL